MCASPPRPSTLSIQTQLDYNSPRSPSKVSLYYLIYILNDLNNFKYLLNVKCMYEQYIKYLSY